MPARSDKGRWGRRIAGLALSAGLAATWWPVVGHSTSAGAAPAPSPRVGRLLLGAADVPHGWKKVAAQKTDVTTRLGCAGALARSRRGWEHRGVTFANGKGLPFVSETLATGPGSSTAFQDVRAALGRCRSASITINGTRHRVTIGPLPFRARATGAVASRWRLVATGVELGIDVVVFQVHRLIGIVSYTDVGTADAVNAARFTDAAISKAGGGRGVVRGVVTVATARVRVARTSDGRVGYRTVGSGPPLVLVMGYGGTMETWDPQFVDMLAHRFTVIVFDNAGIGTTSPLRAPLTIDAMAEQTSALISTLRLGAPDVLGWSMGGLIAEALAVLHPAQVHRLVLCATYPGTGALRPPQATVDDLNAGGTRAQRALFPPGRTGAAKVYTVATSVYAEKTTTPRRVRNAQAAAIRKAWAGSDAALRDFTHIAAPTLVADGALDRLVPPENARRLAAGIAGAKLLVLKGAGHAFLFQDVAPFASAVETFLAG